ncbi:hypothetical protein B0T24DRAFT_627582 [Lasiosphaeria ovina]|uniref:Uncharacterized protein n=1 Tax=Lasiosphaeria ovina TaxID=92902 RepID=A0AAE0K6J6_9PEZI|nr:hypothetical protein B0T24DRAFT_627582 [Lasiosphaeria ovina]
MLAQPKDAENTTPTSLASPVTSRPASIVTPQLTPPSTDKTPTFIHAPAENPFPVYVGTSSRSTINGTETLFSWDHIGVGHGVQLSAQQPLTISLPSSPITSPEEKRAADTENRPLQSLRWGLWPDLELSRLPEWHAPPPFTNDLTSPRDVDWLLHPSHDDVPTENLLPICSCWRSPWLSYRFHQSAKDCLKRMMAMSGSRTKVGLKSSFDLQEAPRTAPLIGSINTRDPSTLEIQSSLEIQSPLEIQRHSRSIIRLEPLVTAR